MIQQPVTKLLAHVHKQQCIPLEELPGYFPELTWNQVFSIVDELSCRALISLQRRGCEYELRPLM